MVKAKVRQMEIGEQDDRERNRVSDPKMANLSVKRSGPRVGGGRTSHDQHIESPKDLRICVVAPSMRLYGGQSIQADRLITALNCEPGVSAELLPIDPRLPGILGLLQRVKYVRTILTELTYLILLLTRLRHFDVIHIFSASYFSFILAPTPAVLIARFFKKPTVLNYHSGEAADHLENWPRTALPIIKKADRLIVPSQYLVDVFARFGCKSEAISNTVELDRFTFRERYPLRPILLSNRNFEKHYNVAGTLRAFALIEKEIPEARLIVAGDGSENEALRALAGELGLKRVEFCGSVPPSRMPELYDAADIFINSSVVDNMPLSIIEAFACGLAIVSSGAGGIPYIINHQRNGILVIPEDHHAMARAVISLLQDQGAAHRMIANAQADSELYTWPAVKPMWIAVYEELVELAKVAG